MGSPYEVNAGITGPFIKYVTLFLANFYPTPCHTLSHIQGPPKVRHTSRTPRFFSRPSIEKTLTKAPCTNSPLNCSRGFCPGGLSGGLLSGRFCAGWFLSIPPSVTIHLLQEKVKHHFKFHV